MLGLAIGRHDTSHADERGRISLAETTFRVDDSEGHPLLSYKFRAGMAARRAGSARWTGADFARGARREYCRRIGRFRACRSASMVAHRAAFA
jgi:hypothetical protein